MNYLVVGRKENGDTVYYTGKAGPEYVSNQMCDAFEYSSIERARKRALMLNTTSLMTGIRFMVPCGDPQ